MDKFTQIPNDILEALILYPLSGLRLSVMLYIIRKTYGWNKDRDYIAINKMAEEMGAYRPRLVGIVHELAAMGLIEIEKAKPNQAAMIRVLPPDRWENTVPERRLSLNGDCTKTDTVSKRIQRDVPKRGQRMSPNGYSTLYPNGDTQNTEIHSSKYNEIQGAFSSDEIRDDELMTGAEWLRRQQG